MLRATLTRLAYKMTGDFGPIGKRKVGKIPLKKMSRLKKGHYQDFIDERPIYGTKEWVAKQYQDDYVNRPQVEGYLAAKQADKYEVLEVLNKFMKDDDKVLNLSYDPSGAISMFLANKLLKFNNTKLSIDHKFLNKIKSLEPSKIPQITTITDSTFPDYKYFSSLQSTNLFNIVKIENTNYRTSSYELGKDNFGPQTLPKYSLKRDYFERVNKEMLTNPILKDKKFTFIIIDPDSSRSKQTGGDTLVMAHLLQNLKIALKKLDKNGRILLKINGIPGLETNERFHKMLALYFGEVEELKLDHMVARGRIGARNMDRRDRFLLCGKFNDDLPVPK